MEKSSTKYIPGVCNISYAEIATRKYIGWFGLGLTLFLWLMFIVFSFSPTWGLLLFFPATASSLGFIQASTHFCARFGFSGLFNLGETVGITESVTSKEFRE